MRWYWNLATRMLRRATAKASRFVCLPVREEQVVRLGEGLALGFAASGKKTRLFSLLTRVARSEANPYAAGRPAGGAGTGVP